MAPRQRVRILETRLYDVPLTFGILRPVILLPASILESGQESFTAILSHELAHVKRRDVLTARIAYLICCLFWFVPFAWSAYARLCLEQEKACDAGVLEQGLDRRKYAGCILEAARICLEPGVITAFSFSGRRKRMLGDRLKSVMQGRNTMKKKGLAVLVAAIMVSCLVLLSAGAGRESVSAEDGYKKFVGEWVNLKYEGTTPQGEPQKIVIKADYTGEDWRTAKDPARDAGWTIKVKKVWLDQDGNTCCQYFTRYTERYSWTSLVLMRLSKDGKTLEIISRNGLEAGTYPEKIDPTARSDQGDWYFVYYRQ
jgi:hypothetical protein